MTKKIAVPTTELLTDHCAPLPAHVSLGVQLPEASVTFRVWFNEMLTSLPDEVAPPVQKLGESGLANLTRPPLELISATQGTENEKLYDPDEVE